MADRLDEDRVRQIVREELAALTPMILSALQKATTDSLLRRNIRRVA